MLEGIDHVPLYGNEPSAIEQVYAIFANVLELDEKGQVLNAHSAQKRRRTTLGHIVIPTSKLDPPYEENWETKLHQPPPSKDLIWTPHLVLQSAQSTAWLRSTPRVERAAELGSVAVIARRTQH